MDIDFVVFGFFSMFDSVKWWSKQPGSCEFNYYLINRYFNEQKVCPEWNRLWSQHLLWTSTSNSTNIDIFNVYMYVYAVMSFRCFYKIATDYLDKCKCVVKVTLVFFKSNMGLLLKQLYYRWDYIPNNFSSRHS